MLVTPVNNLINVDRVLAKSLHYNSEHERSLPDRTAATWSGLRTRSRLLRRSKSTDALPQLYIST